MKCQIHETDMEWVETEAHPDGGYWHCDACQEEEDALFEACDAEEDELLE